MERIKRMIVSMMVCMLLIGSVPVYASSRVVSSTGTSFSDSEIASFEKGVLAAWKAHEKQYSVSKFKIRLSDQQLMEDVYFGLLYRNPQYYYVKADIDISIVNAVLSKITIKYSYSASKVKKMDKKLKTAAKKALAGVESSWSEMEKALYLHDYLCTSCEYDSSLKKFTAYDALVDGKAVCQGYAMAYMYLLKQVGITSRMVRSVSLGHAWNLVRIDKKYYHVDVTWDDPVNDRLGRAKHNFFLKSSAAFLGDGVHTSEDWMIYHGVSPYKASATKYDSCFWNYVDTPFTYVKGKWYAFNYNTNELCSYTSNGKKLKQSGALLSLSGEKWYLWGSTSKFNKQRYVGVGSYKNKIYYSTPKAVYRLNPSNGKTAKVYTLPKARAKSGYIYGIAVTSGGKLRVQISKYSTKTGVTYTAKKL